jgi:hypothetical protein
MWVESEVYFQHPLPSAVTGGGCAVLSCVYKVFEATGVSWPQRGSAAHVTQHVGHTPRSGRSLAARLAGLG